MLISPSHLLRHAPTCSETLRCFITNSFYLISLQTTPIISIRLDRATILGFVARQNSFIVLYAFLWLTIVLLFYGLKTLLTAFSYNLFTLLLLQYLQTSI